MSHENGEATFFARVGKKTGGDDETEPITLPGVEFVRRWSLHILPKSYTTTRRFGGYSNHHRQRYIAECRELLTTAGIVIRCQSPLQRSCAMIINSAIQGIIILPGQVGQ